MKYRNILQIDDDADDCEFFEQALRTISDADYTAIENPIEGLRRLRSGEITPDIIFMDINMPGMSGFQLLAEFKKSKKISKIPVILFSTSDFYEKEAKAFEVMDYIVKPHTLNDLINLIRQIIA